MKRWTVILTFLISFEASASWKETIRPYMQSLFGKELSSKILGNTSDEIVLPPIPKLEKSTTEMNEPAPEKEETVLPEEKRKKYNYLYVKELFLVTRNIQATTEDIVQWTNVLSQGGTREGIYRALVLDNYYASLEETVNPVSPSVVEFSKKFLDKYVSSKVEEEKIAKANFYTLKRVVTEKALEVIDELRSKPDYLSNWYAVFSSEIAQNYPAFWKNKMRKESSKKIHKKWSQSVPEQHLKSEVIIKIHTLMNNLNQS